MVKALLDTDILSEYLKGHDQAVVKRAADYAQQHGVFTFTSVTVYEIVYGLELKSAASQLKKALAWPKRADYAERRRLPRRSQHQGYGAKARLRSRTARLPNCSRRGSASHAACNRQHRGLPGNTKDWH
jgi:predicted nucleic acid-binding protein